MSWPRYMSICRQSSSKNGRPRGNSSRFGKICNRSNCNMDRHRNHPTSSPCNNDSKSDQRWRGWGERKGSAPLRAKGIVQGCEGPLSLFSAIEKHHVQSIWTRGVLSVA